MALIRGSKTIQTFQIAEFAVLSLGVDLLQGSQALRVAEVAGNRKLPIHPVFEAGVVEIPKRSAARCGTARIAEGPGLKNTASAVPEIIRFAEPK